MGIGAQELMIILLVILVLFGGKKIPELLGGLGKGVRNFKKSMNEPDEDEKQAELEKQKQQLDSMQAEMKKLKDQQADEVKKS